MNRKPTLEQLVRQKLLLNELITKEKKTQLFSKSNQQNYSTSNSFTKLKTAQKLHQLNALNDQSSTQNKKWTLGIFILLLFSLSTIYLLTNTASSIHTQQSVTGAIIGIASSSLPKPTGSIGIQSVNDLRYLSSFLDQFSNGINASFYKNTSSLINITTINNMVLINGSVTTSGSSAYILSYLNLSLNYFNASVTINLSNTSGSMTTSSTFAQGGFTFINNSNSNTNTIDCMLRINNSGQYAVAISVGNGPGVTNASLIGDAIGSGTLFVHFDNSTNMMTCSYAGTTVSWTSIANISNEFGIGLKGSIARAGPNPTGGINVTFDGLNYTQTLNEPLCGTYSSSVTLKTDISSSGTCLNITGSNLFVDCNNHNISFGSSNAQAAYGIDLETTTSRINVTVKNCIIQDLTGTSGNIGIRYYQNHHNGTIWNNTIISPFTVAAITLYYSNNTNITNNIITSNGSSHGLDIEYSSNTIIEGNFINISSIQNGIFILGGNATIDANTINTSGSGEAISLTSTSSGTIIQNNIIHTFGNGGNGIDLQSAIATLIQNNIVTSYGGPFTSAFSITDSNASIIRDNNITYSGSAGVGLSISSNSDKNWLINNNITATSQGEISDTTATFYLNYLIYNNSFGEIFWLDNGTGSLQRNLTMSLNRTLGFGSNIFIGNNTIALNKSAWAFGAINGLANLTLYGLNLTSVNVINKVENFTTDAVQIQAAGPDCINFGCNNISYIGNTLKFNTSNFSSFSANYSTFAAASSNTRPSAPAYLQIDFRNLTATTNRTPIFIWQNATDADGDIFSYHLEVDDNPLFNNPEINVTAISPTPANANTTYYATTILNVDTKYFWRVRANDSTGYGTWSNGATVDGPSAASNLSNFTVQSLLQLTLTNNKVEFGAQERGANISSATSNSDNILPFRGENTGNIYINISLNATALFSSVAMNTSNYQFRFVENESNAFSIALSAISWTNMSLQTSAFHLVNLSWQDIKNDFLVDLNMSLPFEESAGVKASTIQFTITSNE